MYLETVFHPISIITDWVLWSSSMGKKLSQLATSVALGDRVRTPNFSLIRGSWRTLTHISKKAGKIRSINKDSSFVLLTACDNVWKTAKAKVWRWYYLTDSNSLLVWGTLGKIAHQIYCGRRHKQRLDRWEGARKFFFRPAMNSVFFVLVDRIYLLIKVHLSMLLAVLPEVMALPTCRTAVLSCNWLLCPGLPLALSLLLTIHA